jgi:Ala-tRNA(Pro) deacylase
LIAPLHQFARITVCLLCTQPGRKLSQRKMGKLSCATPRGNEGFYRNLTKEEVSTMKCRERLEKYLRENAAGFEVMSHGQVFTAQEVAAALHVPGSQVAKVVIVDAGDEMSMFVLPAPYRVNIDEVCALLGVEQARLATEKEFADLFPDCTMGAMPPFGNLYDLPVYVDRSLTEQADIVFRVGTHRESMKLAYADFARLVQPIVGDFSWQM